MKAIVQDRYGTADVLELRDVEDPVVGDEDVLVRVRAAGCGPDVWHLMTGEPYFVRAMPGFRKLWRAPRGRDVAGRVEAVGVNVTDLRPGDDVMGIVEGSFAELALGRPDLLVHKPASIGFDQAAAVPISGLTAVQALRDVAHVRPGQTVLIVGAAGGVGTLAVQIAKADGAHVTAVCSGAKADLVRSLGADDVIDYTREDFTDGRRRWDVIVDCAGRRPVRLLRRALTPKGTLAIVGGDGGGKWTGGFGRQMVRAPILSLFVGQRLRPVPPKESRDGLETLRTLIEDGALTPVVDRTFDLIDAPDAVRYLAQGHAGGKVVVTV
ncbi:MAG: NAD(P)-dependent alcohol dehydrogenase [Planctomycetaceae bacterium]